MGMRAKQWRFTAKRLANRVDPHDLWACLAGGPLRFHPMAGLLFSFLIDESRPEVSLNMLIDPSDAEIRWVRTLSRNEDQSI
jgi:hypothetical protein